VQFSKTWSILQLQACGFQRLGWQYMNRTWKSFREHVNASFNDTLQTNMYRRCVTHSLMKNAQNDEKKESRITCSGYKIQRKFKGDNLKIYET
jgi:hypothetical protein